jgi:chorismate mutase-like protein
MTMPEGASAIETLRREIDALDSQMHDLLIRRSEVAARIGALKSGTGAGAAPRANGHDGALLRPAREAIILRRLVERHRGPLPWGTVVRIWRELMSAVLRAQGPFAVAVYAPAAEVTGNYWDLARDHFGTHTPMSVHESALQVLRAVIDGSATVGILPLPRDDDSQPWWTHLMSADASTPRVCAKLPFGAPGIARGHAVEAFAVGRVAPEATGEDCSLFVLETAAETSRRALVEALQAASFAVSGAWNCRPAQEPALAYHLVELAGFVTPEDERWRGLAARYGNSLRHTWPLGAYAVPLHPAASPA